MQLPRRTSEFVEEPLSRQSRLRLRQNAAQSPAPGTTTTVPFGSITNSHAAGPTPLKCTPCHKSKPTRSLLFTAEKQNGDGRGSYNAVQNDKRYRQSRIAVPTRGSSSERASGSMGLGFVGSHHPGKSSLHLADKTPLKGTPGHAPILKPPGSLSSRKLFTADNHRVAATPIALQNDKRWIHDQLQRITNFLTPQVSNSKIPGVSHDLFASRTGGLRQMSVKHFIAFVNYFLQYVCGNRYKVGANHVEDIVKILQSIQYPYQINKSWLKTPNTPHSFGNVILMFDFFMDFVPHHCNADEVQEPLQFPLLQPQDYTSNQIEDDESKRIPDIEFQENLLRAAEDGFTLWDKQLDDEYCALQQRTRDELIQKRCGVAGLNALKAEITELEQRLKDLEQNCPQIPKQDEDEYNQLYEDFKQTKKETEMIADDLKESDAKKIKQLNKNLAVLNKEKLELENDIKSLKSSVIKQKCTTEERDKLIEELEGHKHTVQLKESSLRDYEDKNHQLQVLHGRTIRKIKEQIHKYNTDVRGIEFSQLNSSAKADDLELPLNAESNDLNRIKPFITSLRDSIEAKIVENTNAIKEFEKENAVLSKEVQYTLDPQINSIHNAIANARKNLEEYKKLIANNSNLQNATKNEKLLQQTKSQAFELEARIAQKQKDIMKMSEENEEIMKKTEKEYYEIAKAREEKVERRNADLEQANLYLLELTAAVNENEKFFENLKQINNP